MVAEGAGSNPSVGVVNMETDHSDNDRIRKGEKDKRESTEEEFPCHVLAISNHWHAKKSNVAAGIFVDRQLRSLKDVGVRISTFDVGTSHSPARLFENWLKIRWTTKQLCPDIIHAQYGTVVALLSVAAGKPAIISFCGADLLPSASVSVSRRVVGFFLSNVAALFAKRVICKSEGLKEALWWRHRGATVIPSGVDLDLFSPGSQDDARQELGWATGRPTALFSVGGDAKIKGLDLVEAAMKEVRSKIANADLRIISNVDPVQMPLYYRAADVLLFASSAEGSPNVIKEALACNLPIVSTAVGDVPERLVNVHPSAVVPRDPKVFGAAVLKILMTRQRSNGREHAAHFSQETIARQILQVYKSVLKPA
jgi:glycosyltransferase involved in cell wall biosynthesis